MNYKTKDNLLTILAVSGIIAVIFTLIIWACWTDNNGVRVSTSRAYNMDITKAQQEQLVYPVEVTSRIEYRGSYVNSESRVVDFCDVKITKKQMKKEMKIVWKEIRKGCE